VTRTIFIQACRISFCGRRFVHPSRVGNAGLILDLAYMRSAFYRQFAATHDKVCRTLFR